MTLQWLTVLALAVLATLASLSAPAVELPLPPGASDAIWRPGLHMRWQIQYTQLPVDLKVATDVYKIDPFDNNAATVKALKSKGKRVVCYVNIGAWENWRPDASRFPQAAMGLDYEGWPGERWLDIRQIDLLSPIMLARLDLCKTKGFDGVLFDNMDSHIQKTGFPITREHQLRYVVWMASAARARGLAVGINNNPEQAQQLLPYVDWAQAESCFSQGWCETLRPFVQAGKPVVVIEYTDDPAKMSVMCRQASALQITLMMKKRELSAFRQDCDSIADLPRRRL